MSLRCIKNFQKPLALTSQTEADTFKTIWIICATDWPNETITYKVTYSPTDDRYWSWTTLTTTQTTWPTAEHYTEIAMTDRPTEHYSTKSPSSTDRALQCTMQWPSTTVYTKSQRPTERYNAQCNNRPTTTVHSAPTATDQPNNCNEDKQHDCYRPTTRPIIFYDTCIGPANWHNYN